MTSRPDLLSQLRQLLAMEQAARVIAPVGGPTMFAGGDAVAAAIPDPTPAQADAMVLGLLAGATDDELLGARAAADGEGQEAAWLADEVDRRGLARP